MIKRRRNSKKIVRSGTKSFFAYEIYDPGGMSLITGPLGRTWMDKTDRRFAYRCLPLLMANTSGWFIKNPVSFSVSWNGGNKKGDTFIEFKDTFKDDRIISHFGSGVLTFRLPYIFRTPKKVNLWVKGPTNWPKDGAQPLEGIVESDWLAATFTMNWKLTRPNYPIFFGKDEPICMIVPIVRGLAENLVPIRCPLSENQQLQSEFEQWRRQREQFLKMLSGRVPETVQKGWQKDYFKGRDVNKNIFPDHQTQILLRDFKRVSNKNGHVE